MGWLRKTWAALVALCSRQRTAEKSALVPDPVEQTPDLGRVPVEMSPDLDASPAPVLDSGTDLYPSPGSPIKALIDQLEKAFPAPSIKPGSDMASLQYAAGQRAVVDWVRMKQKRGQA